VSKAIMIVDDEEDIRNLYGEMLKRDFDKILYASQGVQALNMLDHEKVDHMIIDLEMPNMDGYELAKLVKEKHPKIFMTISTGSIISQDNIDILLSHGVLGFLYKPTSKVELLNHIRCIQSLFPAR